MKIDDLIASVMPAFAPPATLTVSEWAAANRRLPASSASRGARWDNDVAPYLTGIMDSCADPTVHRLVVMGAAQTGKTEALLNALGFSIANDPSTTLWVVPSFADAQRRSRGVLADMLRSTPSLRAVVRGRRAPRGEHEAESTLLEKIYPGGSLILAGSGTPNSFAGISARRAFADEFERFKVLDDGDAATLLTNRTATFYNSLVAFVSTPLLAGGPIDAQFQTTDQRRYFLRCDACGRQDYTTWQDAEHLHVVYEDHDPETARLACAACGARHDEVARRRMIAAGHWRATADPIDRFARGFHVPGTISTLGDMSLSKLVQKWLAARASGPAALMSFVTTVLAEPWEDRGARVEPHALALKLEDYGDGIDAPTGVVCLTAGVDVQIDRFEIAVYGWGRGGECWLTDASDVPGDPSHPEVQGAVLAALDEKYRHASGAMLAIVATCIDSGYLPEKVAYALAARRPRRIFAIKGIGGRFGEPSVLRYDPRQPPVTINVDGLKLEQALGLEMAAPGPGYTHLNRRCCDEEYLAQLCAEHRETRRRAGVATMIWIEDRAANHALDAGVYARAAQKLLVRLSGARTEDSMLANMAERLRGVK